MNKVYDPIISEKNVFNEYVSQCQTNGITAAQNYITDNNYNHLVLQSSVLNQIIDVIYKSDFTGMQSFIGDNILIYISLPPQKWKSGSSYKVGDIVYQANETVNNITSAIYTDTITKEIIQLSTIPTQKAYYCIKNIGVSVNLQNTQYWREIPNYYLSDESLTLQFQTWINRFKIQTYPIWDANTTYYKNNIVSTTDDKIGFCITTNKEGTTAALDSEDWLVLDLQGAKGTLPLGVRFVGEWLNGNSYLAGDMVRVSTERSSSLYIARENITESLTTPSEGEQWMRLLTTGQIGIDVVTSQPSDLNSVSSIYVYYNSGIAWLYQHNGQVATPLYPEARLNDCSLYYYNYHFLGYNSIKNSYVPLNQCVQLFYQTKNIGNLG